MQKGRKKLFKKYLIILSIVLLILVIISTFIYIRYPGLIRIKLISPGLPEVEVPTGPGIVTTGPCVGQIDVCANYHDSFTCEDVCGCQYSYITLLCTVPSGGRVKTCADLKTPNECTVCGCTWTGEKQVSISSTGLTCSVKSDCSGAGEVPIFRMSSTNNAMAGTVTGSSYTNIVCCSGVTGLGNSCSGNFAKVLKLSSSDNAHVENVNNANYGTEVCISGPAAGVDCDYSYSSTSCPTDYVCLASISSSESSFTNAHVGDCNAYTNKVCCKVPPTLILTVQAIVDGTGEYLSNIQIEVDGIKKNTDGGTVTYPLSSGSHSIKVYGDGPREFSHFWDHDCDSSNSGWYLDTNQNPFVFSMYNRDKTITVYYKASTKIVGLSYGGTKITGKLLYENDNPIVEWGYYRSTCSDPTLYEKKYPNRDVKLYYNGVYIGSAASSLTDGSFSLSWDCSRGTIKAEYIPSSENWYYSSNMTEMTVSCDTTSTTTSTTTTASTTTTTVPNTIILSPPMNDVTIYSGIWVRDSHTYLKFKINSIPSGKTILTVKLYLYLNSSESGQDNDVQCWRVNSQTWTESDSVADIWNLALTNQKDATSKWTTTGWDYVDVKDGFMVDYNAGNTYTSYRLTDPDYNTYTPNVVDNDYELYIGNHAVGALMRWESQSHPGGHDPYLEVSYMPVSTTSTSTSTSTSSTTSTTTTISSICSSYSTCLECVSHYSTCGWCYQYPESCKPMSECDLCDSCITGPDYCPTTSTTTTRSTSTSTTRTTTSTSTSTTVQSSTTTTSLTTSTSTTRTTTSTSTSTTVQSSTTTTSLTTSTGPSSTTTTSASSSTTTTTISTEVFDMSNLICNKSTTSCSFNVNRNTHSRRVVVFVYLFKEPEGIKYFSSNVNVMPGTTGRQDLILSEIKSCPAGITLKALALAYREDDLTTYIKRLKVDAFTC
jgi:hypothetical protein